MAPRLLAEHDLSSAELSSIEECLNSDNRRLTGSDDHALVFVLRDENGRAVGAAAGYSWAGIAELTLMWVDEACRGLGYGRRLLDAFVAEAAARGSVRIWVSTHDFQAPGFYERAGFERMAELTGWPEGHSNIILCKTMRSHQSNSRKSVRGFPSGIA